MLPAEEIVEDAKLPAKIKKHCDEIASADGIVIVHPNWWGQPPAILKGWVDRVIRPDVAYEFMEGDSGEGAPKGLLKAKAALIYNTSNTEPQREKDVFGGMFNVIVTSTEAQRKNWIDSVREDIDIFFPK